MGPIAQLTQNALFNMNNEERARAEKTLLEKRSSDPLGFLVECAKELGNPSVPVNVKVGLGTLLDQTIVINVVSPPATNAYFFFWETSSKAVHFGIRWMSPRGEPLRSSRLGS